MNVITKKQYEEIKNKTSYAVVRFKENKRCGTYGGLSLIQAVEEIKEAQKLGLSYFLIENLPYKETSWNKEDYLKYL